MFEQLLANGPVTTDGAWGTQLQARGLPIGECPDLWNLACPERVEEVARAYVEAGSQIIITNTFRANRISLEGGDIAAVNRAGVEISRRAAAGRALVFATIGPSGKMLLTGEVTETGLADAFAEQADALAAAGADALLVETQSDVAEARLAVEAACRTGLPVVASLVFDTGKNRDRTMMGEPPEKAAEAMLAAGAAFVGANCGRGVAGYVDICRRMRAVCGGPVWIKANAGIPELVDGRPVYRMTPEEYASYVPALVEAGAGFIGGCCGTGPAFVRAIREGIRQCV